MQRLGQVIGIKPEHLERYTQMHAQAWPEMIPMQAPVPDRQPGEHWARLKAVYHQA
jgi:hypothetical protein